MISAVNSFHPKKKHYYRRNHHHHHHNRHRHRTMPQLRHQPSNSVFMTASSRTATQQSQSHPRSSPQIYPTTATFNNDDNDNNNPQPNNNDNLSHQQWLVNISLLLSFV
ncbi:unnamed protein product [Cercopithifilaria johnstoni]|uniref:Uncharacterized protein n=1 Tax=Cercopithifilaria johnstoni TaxID=2874296 RepID=A0A8J2LVF1_9BILA|nr:unnamed protein product [Cercopithifilaria johnstoni]